MYWQQPMNGNQTWLPSWFLRGRIANNPVELHVKIFGTFYNYFIVEYVVPSGEYMWEEQDNKFLRTYY